MQELGDTAGGKEEMADWIHPRVKKWADTAKILGWYAMGYIQEDYSGIYMLLQ